MKTSQLFREKENMLRCLLLAAALVLLIIARVLSASGAAALILAILSLLASLASLRQELTEAIRKRDLRSGLLLLILACILCVCVGSAASAALAMLLRGAAALLLPLVEAGVRTLLDTRRELLPLRQQIPQEDAEPQIAGRIDSFLENYFTYLAILLAALTAVLAATLGKAGISEALGRAAVVLSLGGCFPFFAAFPLNDAAAILRAGECGVLFRRDSLTRLMKRKLACVKPAQGVTVGSATVYPVRPEAVSGELMVRLAARALHESSHPAAPLLDEIHPPKENTPIPERKEFPELGVVAKVKGVTVIVGSGEFMLRSGLQVLPFPANPHLLHLGVNGHYVGCVDLDEGEQKDDVTAALESSGFFCFRDGEEATDKRLPGEAILFVSPAGDAVPSKDGDLLAFCGAEDRHNQITVERCGKAGVLAMLDQLRNAQLGRKGSILVALIVKAFLLLLALFGICPLWLAVLLEAAAIAFTYRYTIHLLDFNGGH